jgi:hypothetical protein
MQNAECCAMVVAALLVAARRVPLPVTFFAKRAQFSGTLAGFRLGAAAAAPYLPGRPE